MAERPNQPDEESQRQTRIVADYEAALAACPFTEDSREGQAWMLGAIWGDEQRRALVEVVEDLKGQVMALEYARKMSEPVAGEVPADLLPRYPRCDWTLTDIYGVPWVCTLPKHDSGLHDPVPQPDGKGSEEATHVGE